MVDGCTGSVKGHVSLFRCIGLRRDTTHPKDVIIHEGEIWSPYKRTRVHNQGRKESKKA
jgi:hypothetical protein